MVDDSIQVLRSDCREALIAFVHEADKTNEFFDRYVATPLSHEDSGQLLNQRIAENAAFERYQRARCALLDFAKNGYRHQRGNSFA